MQQLQKGTIIWFDLPTRDSHTSMTFYTALFGWKFELFGESHERKYWNILRDDSQIGGLYECEDVAHSGPGPVMYFVVEGLDEALSQAEHLGARIYREKTQIPQDGGFYAHIVDTDNNVVGLWSQT